MAQKLNVELTDDILNQTSNEAASNILLEKALESGKSQDEISAALEWDIITIEKYKYYLRI